jgi:hypothetical protein
MIQMIAPKKSDKLIVHYAQLPVTDLNVRFLVEQVEPIQTIPRVISISHLMHYNNTSADSLDILKSEILLEWINTLGIDKVEGLEWAWDIEEVELIECNILTPK